MNPVDRGPTQDAATAQKIAVTVLIDVLTGEVLTALRGAGIDPILLKGPAFDEWLYDDRSRTYVDVDLLVAPTQYAEAEQVLANLGFASVRRPYESNRRLEHDSLWRRPGTPGCVDLHRTLPQVRGTSPEQVWRHLRPHTKTMVLPRPGGTARILDGPARALLLTLHAAHHVGYGDVDCRPVAELRRAIGRTSAAEWAQARDLARAMHAAPQMSLGLRAVAAGDRLADELRLPSASSNRNEAAGFERLAASSSSTARLRLLARALFPSPDYLRWSSPLARRGRGGLVAAYLSRPILIAAHAPWSYVVWRRHRATPGR